MQEVLLFNHQTLFLVLTPQQVSKQEHILPFWSTWRKFLRVKLPHELVHLGAKASTLAHSDM
jgi:hypothetical protein